MKKNLAEVGQDLAGIQREERQAVARARSVLWWSLGLSVVYLASMLVWWLRPALLGRV
jgi:hypothetical protein